VVSLYFLRQIAKQSVPESDLQRKPMENAGKERWKKQTPFL